jgi:hypothetical protein
MRGYIDMHVYIYIGLQTCTTARSTRILLVLVAPSSPSYIYGDIGAIIMINGKLKYWYIVFERIYRPTLGDVGNLT